MAVFNCRARALRRTKETDGGVSVTLLLIHDEGRLLTHAIEAEQYDLRYTGRVLDRIAALEHRRAIDPMLILPERGAKNQVIHAVLPSIAGEVNFLESDVQVSEIVATGCLDFERGDV